MGEGVAMRHTLIRRVEDAEELGPQEGAPWVERGWTPLPAPWRRAPHTNRRRAVARGYGILSDPR